MGDDKELGAWISIPIFCFVIVLYMIQVGDDKELGASISIAIRHPNSQVVGVMQVCRSEGEEGFGYEFSKVLDTVTFIW